MAQSKRAKVANYLCRLNFRSPLGSANDFSELSQLRLRLCPFAGSPTFLQWTVLHTVPINLNPWDGPAAFPSITRSPKTRPARSGSRALPAASSHSIALLDLYRSVVDRRQHLRRIAGDDDVDHRWAVAFFHSSPQRAGQRFRILNADAAAAHRAGDRGVIHLDKVGRLIAAAHHRVLQRLDVTRRGVVDDNHREPEPGAARGFQLAEHHIEPAIARNCDDGSVRRGKARPHPARQSVANRREAAVRDEMPPGDFGVVEQAGPMTGKPAIGD